MADTSDIDILIETLQRAGVKAPPGPRLNIIAFSGPDKADNKRLHEITNNLITDLLIYGDLGNCIHVTGEMRALTDPLHRQLCAEMRRKDKGTFEVLYNIPESHRLDPLSISQWNLSRWASGTSRLWDEELRTLDLLARRSVDIRAYDTLNELQYSVFGHRYIQLQEAHKDDAKGKRIPSVSIIGDTVHYTNSGP